MLEKGAKCPGEKFFPGHFAPFFCFQTFPNFPTLVNLERFRSLKKYKTAVRETNSRLLNLLKYKQSKRNTGKYR